MDLYSRSSPRCLADDGDVDNAPVRAQFPDRRRRLVAEHAAGREYRRHLRSALGDDRPDAVDPPVQAHEPSVRHPMRNRARSHTCARKLRGRNDPVLTGSEFHHRRVARVHFVHATRYQPAAWTLCTSGVHFAHRSNEIAVTWTKCTFGHLY